MQLIRLMKSAGLALPVCLAVSPTNAVAQAVASSMPVSTNIRPFASVAFGPTVLTRERENHGGGHPAFDLSVGARRRMNRMLGVVATANYGKMLDVDIGGEDAICRAPASGQGACLPISPPVNWFGAAAGAEAYFGKTILGLQFGPTSVSVPKYERDFFPGSSSRAWGLRTQFDANFPVTRQFGLSVSAADRYVPDLVNDKWHIRSISVGVSLGAFRKAR